MPKRLLVDGAFELLLLGLPSLIPKRPFADRDFDVALLEEPNPEKPVVLGGVPLDASPVAVVPKKLLVELAFDV